MEKINSDLKLLISNLSQEELSELIKYSKYVFKHRFYSKQCDARRKFILSLDPSKHDNYKDLNKEILLCNKRNLLSLRNISEQIQSREKYLGCLIGQDWSKIFDSNNDPGNFYVYAHVDPSMRIFVTSKKYGGNYKGTPFYIGKGNGNRAYDLKRNQGHGRKIKSVLENGWKPEDIVHIAFDNLNEQKAYELESKLIYFFGTIYEKERKFGCLYNLDIPKTPIFSGEMEKIITNNSFLYKKASEIKL